MLGGLADLLHQLVAFIVVICQILSFAIMVILVRTNAHMEVVALIRTEAT